MKLNEYAKKIGVTYRTAYNWFKRGYIKNAMQMPSGTIIIDDDETSVNQIEDEVFNNETIKEFIDNDIHHKKCFLNGEYDMRSANVKYEMNEEEKSIYTKCKNDPIYFLENYGRYMMTIDGYMDCKEIYPQEYEMYKRLLSDEYLIMLTQRQCGLTTMSAVALLYNLMFSDRQIHIVTMFKRRNQSIDLINKIMNLYRRLPYFLKRGISKRTQNTIRFDNSNELSANVYNSNPSTGYVINYLYLFDFDSGNQNMLKEYWASVYPVMRSTDSKIMICSSNPCKDTLLELLYKDAKDGKNKFKTYKVLGCHSEEWLLRQLNDLGEKSFKQQMLLEFV